MYNVLQILLKHPAHNCWSNVKSLLSYTRLKGGLEETLIKDLTSLAKK